MEESFNWLDSLGISVTLFLAIGAFWILVGALGVSMLHTSMGRKIFSSMDREIIFLSPSVDEEFFGVSPEELLASNPPLAKFRTIWMTAFAGSMALAGLLFVSITWFGLRNGYPWALISLTLSTVLALFLWAFTLQPYIQAGVRFGIFNLPPFIVIPGVLIIPAVVLGWIGIR